MIEARFKRIFGPEPRRRPLRFHRLRGFAVSGLALVSFAGPGPGHATIWAYPCEDAGRPLQTGNDSGYHADTDSEPDLPP